MPGSSKLLPLPGGGGGGGREQHCPAGQFGRGRAASCESSRVGMFILTYSLAEDMQL